MRAVRLTLSNGEHDEHQLDICNQGVVLDFSLSGEVDVVCVATGDTVCTQEGRYWVSGRSGLYSKLYVQTVELEQEVDTDLPSGANPDDMIASDWGYP